VRNRKEVVFYFLARILKNEEQESRRKQVKDTPLAYVAPYLLKTLTATNHT